MRKLPAVFASFVIVAAAAPALVRATDASLGGEERPTRTVAAQAEPTAPQRAKRARSSSEKLARGSRYLLPRIARHRRATWHWQALMGKPLTSASKSVHRSRAKTYRKWVLRLWKRRHAAARRQALNPPHEYAWRCLQRYEGSWRDTGAPYYGGLQMDWGFMRAYGSFLLRRKGPANNWTPLEQMWVAERALRAGRGFYPWPNAGRLCGLI